MFEGRKQQQSLGSLVTLGKRVFLSMPGRCPLPAWRGAGWVPGWQPAAQGACAAQVAPLGRAGAPEPLRWQRACPQCDAQESLNPGLGRRGAMVRHEETEGHNFFFFFPFK